MANQIAHPMVKLQSKVASLVNSNLIKPEDQIWKIALLFGGEWSYWKKELKDFEFSMSDSIDDLLQVEEWEEEQ
jgi:hypothetical protein